MNGNTFATWEDVRKEMFTPEEIAESNLRVALIGELVKARKERGLSQKQLEELTGVKQPVIARMENGSTTPNLSTILKVLAPLGKTLYIGDLKIVHKTRNLFGAKRLKKDSGFLIFHYSFVQVAIAFLFCNRPFVYACNCNFCASELSS